MHKLVLVRHGESTWNLENRFTGWTDVDLTPTGVAQARSAGRLLKAEGYEFDVAYTSVLKRAIWTLWHALDQMDRTWLPVVNDWRLNERHYGALQGLNKAETAREYGDAQVLAWRRSYDTPPPPLAADDPRSERGDPRYAALRPGAGAAHRVPEGHRRARPAVLARARSRRRSAPGQRVLVAAHGNSMRALVKYLDGISDADIVGLNIPNGIPLVYELDDEAEADPQLLPRRRRGGGTGGGGGGAQGKASSGSDAAATTPASMIAAASRRADRSASARRSAPTDAPSAGSRRWIASRSPHATRHTIRAASSRRGTRPPG